jgi:hypothetical protein
LIEANKLLNRVVWLAAAVALLIAAPFSGSAAFVVIVSVLVVLECVMFMRYLRRHA